MNAAADISTGNWLRATHAAQTGSWRTSSARHQLAPPPRRSHLAGAPLMTPAAGPSAPPLPSGSAGWWTGYPPQPPPPPLQQQQYAYTGPPPPPYAGHPPPFYSYPWAGGYPPPAQQPGLGTTVAYSSKPPPPLSAVAPPPSPGDYSRYDAEAAQAAANASGREAFSASASLIKWSADVFPSLLA